MVNRSWLILTVGFGALIIIIGLMGAGALLRSEAILTETMVAHQTYFEADASLRRIQTDLLYTAILVRDYLMDLSHISSGFYKEEIRLRERSINAALDQLQRARPPAQEQVLLNHFREELREFFEARRPILDWSPQQKYLLGSFFLRNTVIPRRQSIIGISEEIASMNTEVLRKERARLRERQQNLEDFLRRMLAFALGCGILVALVSTTRVATLERRSDEQRRRAERAEAELRKLSRKLVRAQEDERKALSRELHDAVGQMLSAMGMELANLEAARETGGQRFRDRLVEARKLNTETLHAVRDLATGLRPSMLDELGLAPALRWQARDYSRRSGVPVDVQLDGQLEGLSEAHRTCVFRVVQEALTNCARHAQAKHIRISVYGGPDELTVAVSDDGVGFDPNAAHGKGLGLLGIEERAHELGGSVKVVSQPGRGAMLELELPLQGRDHEQL